MDRKRIVFGQIIFVACVVSAAFSFVLLRNETLAVVSYVLGLSALVLFIEPFVGLLNYLFVVYVRPQEFIEGLKGLPLILFLGTATLAMTVIHLAVRRKRLLRTPQDYLMLWLYAAVIITNLAQFYIAGATTAANEFLSRIVVYFLVSWLIITIARLNAVWYMLLLLTLFHAINGIVQYHTGVGVGGLALLDGRIRGIGIFADPNDLALTFLLVIPFVYFKLTEARLLLHRIFLFASGVTLIYAMFLTNSRGGMLSFLFVVYLLMSRKIGRRAALLGGVALVALMLVAGPSRMRGMSGREETAGQRIDAWAAGIDMFQSRPLFGVGSGRFLDHYFRDAHNSFVQVAGEMGIFGTFPWVLLIFVSLKNLYYIRNALEEADADGGGGRRDPLILYTDSALYGLIGFVTAAMFITRTYNDLLFILLGIASATTMLFVDRRGGRFQLIERRDFRNAFIIMIGALLAIKLLVMLYF